MKSRHLLSLFIILCSAVLPMTMLGQPGGGGGGAGAGGGAAAAPGLKYIIRPTIDTISKSNFIKRTIGYLFKITISKWVSGDYVSTHEYNTTNVHSSNYIGNQSKFLIDSGVNARNVSTILSYPNSNSALLDLAIDSIRRL